MWNSHSSVGLAQAIFYLPLVLAAAFLLFRRHGRPKMPWIALFAFSTVRFIGGIMFIIYSFHPSLVGWIIVTLIFQGAGVIPLIILTLGLLRLIHALDLPTNERFRKLLVMTRVFLVVGIGLLVTGSSLLGNYKSESSSSLGLKLAKSGYAILAAVLAILFIFEAWLWTSRRHLGSDGKRILLSLTTASPFLVIRITYACLSVFNSSAKWSTLVGGNVAALVCMHSLMEYVALLLFVACGYSIQPTRGILTQAKSNEAEGSRC